MQRAINGGAVFNIGGVTNLHKPRFHVMLLESASVNVGAQSRPQHATSLMIGTPNKGPLKQSPISVCVQCRASWISVDP